MRRLLPFALFYILILCTPLALSFVLPHQALLEPRPWRDDLASGLGMVAFTVVLMEFFLLGRFRPLSSLLGSDLAMQAHQLMSRTAVVLLLLHPVLYSLWGRRPLPFDLTYARVLRVEEQPWALLTGLLALGALLTMILLAIYRAGFEYDRWRLWHGLMALAVVGLGLHHTLIVGRYAQLLVLNWFWWGLAMLAFASWLGVYLVRPLLQARRPYRLSRVTPLAQKIWEIEICPGDGKTMQFAPGQFAWLKLGGLAPHKDHPFSISSAHEPLGILRFVIKEAGDFTRSLTQLPVGTVAYLDGPYGNFRIPAQAESVVMIAGGIGIAPFLGLLSACAQQGERRPIRLIYADRDVSQMVNVTELSDTQKLSDFRQILMVEKQSQGWSGLVGRLDSAGLAQAFACENLVDLTTRAHFMVCGPSQMMEAVEVGLSEHGIALGRIQSEHFQFDFSGRAPRTQNVRRGWLALSAMLVLLSLLVAVVT